jgi:hypothetical protein
VYRDRDVVAKGVVIQYIDRKEKKYIDEPTSDWDAIWLEEEGWSIRIELGAVAGASYKEELHKSEESP